MILLDTCALIDLISPKPSLSNETFSLMEKEGVMILSISFAEIACKISLGKLMLNMSPITLQQYILETENFRIQDITVKMWLDAIALSWSHEGKMHKDPADRLILSYAEAHALPLITTDQLMKKRYAACIW